MSTPRTVKCLDAKYDAENGYLVLNCTFGDEGQRIVYFHKEDFHYHGNPVPDAEMFRTAEMFRGKPFNLVVDDDPSRNTLTDDEQLRCAAMFNKRITEELGKVSEGLESEDRIMQRHMDRLSKKIIRGKLR